jgi:hypothetical protein
VHSKNAGIAVPRISISIISIALIFSSTGCTKRIPLPDETFGDEIPANDSVGDDATDEDGDDGNTSGEGSELDDDDDDDDDDGTDDSSDVFPDLPKFDLVSPGDLWNDTAMQTDSNLTGRVFAPNGTLPISGALVYSTFGGIDSIPEQSFCQSCVQLDPSIAWTLTEADGTFNLPAHSGKDVKLVVQKGQFRRVTTIDIAPGTSAVPVQYSTLPANWNPGAGEWIPKMAVVQGTWDSIQDVLAKIGLGEIDIYGSLEVGSEKFDFLQTNEEAEQLLDNLEEMKKYHIIFMPCGAFEKFGNSRGSDFVSDQRIENIREYIRGGGKWYVTDWTNEFLYAPFPDYQTFTRTPGGQTDLDEYESRGIIVDDNLLHWLSALPPEFHDPGDGLPTLADLPEVQLIDNWSAVESTPEILATDSAGNTVNVGHYTWVEAVAGGPYEPNLMTITAPFSCGKMMFSTFHTAEYPHLGIAPQELILIYLILEIGVCQDSIDPPK